MSEELQESGALGAQEPKMARRWRPKLKVVLAVVAVVVVVVVAGALAAGFSTGVLSPADAAAKYDGANYISEADVTDYILTYKAQMGCEDASDAEWATFLAAYNLTPARLRASTIDQMLTDALVRKKCDELGIRVTQTELDEAIQNYKDGMASGSDSIWRETLEAHNQSEEGFRDSIELTMLKQKLAEHEVESPEVSDEQLRTTLATYIDAAISNEDSLLLKHTYCFKKSYASEEEAYESSKEVEKIRQGLLDVGVNEESFASIVQLYSDDAELKESAGANGWNADTSGYSDTYVKALETVNSKGDVSSVFTDDGCHFFVWVSDTYELPEDSSKADDIDLETMPQALHQYFSDIAAYALWQTEAKEYLSSIAQSVDVLVYEMPSDVPYNVDMSLAQSTDEDEAEDEESGGADESD